ncbi:MAG: peroxiredoxin Q/BCP [Parcubacteria group bacterium Gr01-1014_19]|nr:MAG: peroxiredoxin Q/BCP [Parcubacteria group bacterium Gr01-1014_19]
MEFELPDQNGKIHKLSDYNGQWVLVYFYPKDDTPGCVKEACAIRDNFPEFQKLGIQVFGISSDSEKSHFKFVEKYTLPFTLLSDEKRITIKRWGAWAEKRFMGRSYMGTLRMSFLIDPTGKVAKKYDRVKPEVHAEEVLADLKKLIALYK